MNAKGFRTTAYMLAALSVAGTAAAQDTSKFAFNVGGGFTEPVVHTDGRATTGFNVTAGAGLNFAPQFGISAEFGYNHLDLSNRVLNAVGVPGGNTHIYSVTLEPTVHLNPHGRFGALLAVAGLAVPLMFVHQLSRGAARVRVVESLSGIAVPFNPLCSVRIRSERRGFSPPEVVNLNTPCR